MWLLVALSIIGFAIDEIKAGDTSGLLRMTGFYLISMFVAWMGQYQQVYQMTWAGLVWKNLLRRK